jgi:hypothetical protein
LRTIDGALQTWKAEHPTDPWPLTSAAATTDLVPNYLKAWPQCPEAAPVYTFTDNGSVAPTVVCPNDATHVYP